MSEIRTLFGFNTYVYCIVFLPRYIAARIAYIIYLYIYYISEAHNIIIRPTYSAAIDRYDTVTIILIIQPSSLAAALSDDGESLKTVNVTYETAASSDEPTRITENEIYVLYGIRHNILIRIHIVFYHKKQ